MMRDDFAVIIDAEILAIRARHATRLHAEHARIAHAKQRVIDAGIVAAREARIAHERVLRLVRA